MRVANVLVAARLKDGVSAIGNLPNSRASAKLNGNQVIISTEEASQSHEYDFVIENVDEKTLVAKLEIPSLLRQLLQGISLGVLGMGVEGEKIGAFGPVLKDILYSLQDILNEQGTVKVSLSFSIFGITDTSCIDLLNYSRKDLEQIQSLVEWTPLNHIDSIEPVCEAINQGYSLPCVILLRLFCKAKEGESLPGTMSTLLLADLGSTSPGAALEKSFAQLRSNILTMDQAIVHYGQLATQNSYLSALIGECFGGAMMTLVIADIPKTFNARNLQSFIQLLDATRRVKNHPAPLLETPVMLELEMLVEAHGMLELEHRAVRRELKQLQRALKLSEMQRKELTDEYEFSNQKSLREKLELEYEIARIQMERVQVHERIRQCEIDLVCTEHGRLLLLAQMENKHVELTNLEEKLRSSTIEKEEIKEEFVAKVTGLTGKLDEAQKQLEIAEKEKRHLKSSLNSATNQIVSLESQIAEMENAKDKVQLKLERANVDNVKRLETKSAELVKLQNDLSKAKDSEKTLSGKLAELEHDSILYQSTVKDLEGKLGALKVENVTLQAKLEVLSSRKPQSPEISRTIKFMEDKWAQEREAMHSVMNDLRGLIKDKGNFSILDNEPPTLGSKTNKLVPREISQDAAAAGGGNGDDSDGGDDNNNNRNTLKQDHPKKSTRSSRPIKSIVFSESDSDDESQEEEGGGGGTKGEDGLYVNSNKNERMAKSKSNSNSRKPAKSKRPIVKRKTLKDKVEEPAPAITTTKITKIPESSKDNTVKLAKIKNSSRVAEVPSIAIEKILDSESVDNGKVFEEGVLQDTIIPGTPQKASPPSHDTTGAGSPAKVWKASAFIPSIARKHEPTKVFANLSFSEAGNDFRKRIKLPERLKSTSQVSTIDTTRERRNVDPNVYSTIMTSFDISSTSLKK